MAIHITFGNEPSEHDKSGRDNPKTGVVRSPLTLAEHRGRLNTWILGLLARLDQVDHLNLYGKDSDGHIIDLTYEASSEKSLRFNLDGADKESFSIEEKPYKDSPHLSKVSTWYNEHKEEVMEFLENLPDGTPIEPLERPRYGSTYSYDVNESEAKPTVVTKATEDTGIASIPGGVKSIPVATLLRMTIPQRFAAMYQDNEGEEPELETLTLKGGHQITIAMSRSHCEALVAPATMNEWLITLPEPFSQVTLAQATVETSDIRKVYHIRNTYLDYDRVQSILRLKYGTFRGVDFNTVELMIGDKSNQIAFIKLTDDWYCVLSPVMTDDDFEKDPEDTVEEDDEAEDETEEEEDEEEIESDIDDIDEDIDEEEEEEAEEVAEEEAADEESEREEFEKETDDEE